MSHNVSLPVILDPWMVLAPTPFVDATVALAVAIALLSSLALKKLKICFREHNQLFLNGRVADGYAVDHSPEVDLLGENDRVVDHNYCRIRPDDSRFFYRPVR